LARGVDDRRLARRSIFSSAAGVLYALGTAGLLVANPNALFGASFQMSFLCVALIAGIAVPFLERTIAPYSQALCNLDALAWDRSLPPPVAQFRIDLRMILRRISFARNRRQTPRVILFLFRGSFAAAELAVISAVMLTLPMAFYFHRATAVATPANLLAVPFLHLLPCLQCHELSLVFAGEASSSCITKPEIRSLTAARKSECLLLIPTFSFARPIATTNHWS
jgi:Competence protein